jgi:peptide/nickel transport system substrate-binding protein
MPAAAPIPPEFGKCFTKAGEYGRDIVSTGPYMFQGMDAVKAGPCSAVKPASGFNPTNKLFLVRNPNYDPKTDTTEARENYFDKLQMVLNTNPKDIFNRVKLGQADLAEASEPSDVLREYVTNPSLKNQLRVDPGDRTWYITMNLTEPPFDDIHVRKAVNWVMDLEGLRRAFGGPVQGDIAHHIVPNTMFNGDLDNYNPYSTPGNAGDVAKAKAEMKQSKYDTNHDGICDAPECKNILHVTENRPVDQARAVVIESSLKKIGMTIKTRELASAYTIIQTTSNNVPLSSRPGWGKDYADALTFFEPLFASTSILPEGNVNYSLVGVSKYKGVKKLGLNAAAMKHVASVPSIDDRIDKCEPLTGSDRLHCWEDLDKYVMENIVPWVPYLDANNTTIIGPAVSKYVYDQFAGEPAWAHIAVDTTKQK